jgi:TonB family protein
MNKSRFVFFLAVLGVVVGIARYNSRSTTGTTVAKPAVTPPAKASSNLLIPPPNSSPAVTPTPSAVLAQAQTPADLQKLAERVSPSVLALSIFDGSGKLLRNGTGFFISEDGRFVTSRSIVDGAAHAVAKASDGRIYNVNGILAEATPADVAVLKAQVKERVPFISPSRTAPFEAGGELAAVGSPLNRKENTVARTSVAGRKSDANSEWLVLTTSLPGDSLGAPVINDRGDVLGLVTLQRGDGPAVNVVRMASALDPVFARIDARTKPAWAVQAPPDVSPPPPAEGPLQKSALALAGQVPPGQKRLVFSPTPQYPSEARRGFHSVKGAGRYRVHFGRDGSVRDVQVIQSTSNQILDSAAIDTLRKWKSIPGQEWNANVPISFQP